MDEYIDNYIGDSANWNRICAHNKYVTDRKEACLQQINNSPVKERRTKQYLNTLDDAHEFRFIGNRKQTRYRQVNYQRIPYTVTIATDELDLDFEHLQMRHDSLSSINFETSLRKYSAKKQRNLLTPGLRQQIILRDNYTCQICGKYMPDGIGLQIDHIVPVSAGGKTVPSNLRVLCSKCNASNGNRIKTTGLSHY